MTATAPITATIFTCPPQRAQPIMASAALRGGFTVFISERAKAQQEGNIYLGIKIVACATGTIWT